MERQPFTWLRAAPYIAIALAGVAFFAVGVTRMSRHSCSRSAAGAAADDENKIAGCDALGYFLAIVGAVLAMLTAYVASLELSCVPRLDQAADD